MKHSRSFTTLAVAVGLAFPALAQGQRRRPFPPTETPP